MNRDTRLWMYRQGESRLFEHPDHVPEEEGWQRFPPSRHCERQRLDAIQSQAAGAVLDRHGAKAPRDDAGSASSAGENLDEMSRQELMQAARECGVRFAFNSTKAQLKQAILEAKHGHGT